MPGCQDPNVWSQSPKVPKSRRPVLQEGQNELGRVLLLLQAGLLLAAPAGRKWFCLGASFLEGAPAHSEVGGRENLRESKHGETPVRRTRRIGAFRCPV